jgi:hypothetical protein
VSGLLQIASFFEGSVGPVAKLSVQRDCRQLIRLGQSLHTAKLAAERKVNCLLKACHSNCRDSMLQGHASRLEALVASIDDLKGAMDAELSREQPIVSTFITFKCDFLVPFFSL